MRAIRTKEGQTVNPFYSLEKKREARAAGETYDTPQFLTLEVGEVIEHAQCWRLCVKGVAVPDDEECRAKVLEYVGDPGRKALIESIQLMRMASKATTLSKKDARYLDMLERGYAHELGLSKVLPVSPTRESSVQDEPPVESEETHSEG